MRQPLPNRLVRLLSEARWIALAVMFLYFVLILLTYNKADPGWSHDVVVTKAINVGGRAGAWLADLMLFIFGFSAWWWCVCFARLLWKDYRQLSDAGRRSADPSRKTSTRWWSRWIGFVLMFAGSVGLEYLRMYTLHAQLPRAPGGVLGQIIGHSRPSRLRLHRRHLLLLLLFGLGCSLFFHVSWLSVAERIGARPGESIDWFRLRYQDREDRKQGEVAAVKRDEVVVQERAKHVEKHVAAPPVKIEPQVVGAADRQVRARRKGKAGAAVPRSAGRLRPAAAVPAGRGCRVPGNRVGGNAGVHQPPDRKEIVRLRRRSQGGGGLSGPGGDPLRNRAGHRRQGQPDRRPGARPGPFAVA